jgi:hypothetical protein
MIKRKPQPRADVSRKPGDFIESVMPSAVGLGRTSTQNVGDGFDARHHVSELQL